jgi:hypothetical protein
MSSLQNGFKRPVRIAGVSGGQLDRNVGISTMAKDPEIDAIVGDWLSENTMTVQGMAKVKSMAASTNGDTPRPLEEAMKTANYANQFVDCFTRALDDLAKNHIKLAVNAGGSDTELLAKVCQKLAHDAGHDLKVAWVEGDEVTEAFQELHRSGEKFQSLIDGQPLDQWGFEPLTAQCYLGSMGIAEALRNGADIVIAGRVADAAPAMGVAM